MSGVSFGDGLSPSAGVVDHRKRMGRRHTAEYVNFPPISVQNEALSIGDDAVENDVVGNLLVTGTLTSAEIISDASGGFFKLGTIDGQLLPIQIAAGQTLVAGAYSVTIRISGNGGTLDWTDDISIEPTVDPGESIEGLSFTTNGVVPNDSANGYAVGTLVMQGGVAPAIYSLTDDLSGLLTVNSSTGIVTIADNTGLAALEGTSPTFGASVTDSNSPADTEPATPSFDVEADAPPATEFPEPVATIAYSSPSAASSHVIPLPGGSGGRFMVQVGADLGAVVVWPSPYDTNELYNVSRGTIGLVSSVAMAFSWKFDTDGDASLTIALQDAAGQPLSAHCRAVAQRLSAYDAADFVNVAVQTGGTEVGTGANTADAPAVTTDTNGCLIYSHLGLSRDRVVTGPGSPVTQYANLSAGGVDSALFSGGEEQAMAGAAAARTFTWAGATSQAVTARVAINFGDAVATAPTGDGEFTFVPTTFEGAAISTEWTPGTPLDPPSVQSGRLTLVRTITPTGDDVTNYAALATAAAKNEYIRAMFHPTTFAFYQNSGGVPNFSIVGPDEKSDVPMFQQLIPAGTINALNLMSRGAFNAQSFKRAAYTIEFYLAPNYHVPKGAKTIAIKFGGIEACDDAGTGGLLGGADINMAGTNGVPARGDLYTYHMNKTVKCGEHRQRDGGTGFAGSFTPAGGDIWWARGTWLKMEAEFLMNDAGQANGGLWCWVNGTMVAASTDIEWRNGTQLWDRLYMTPRQGGSTLDFAPNVDNFMWIRRITTYGAAS